MVASYFSNYYFDLGETLGLKFIRAQSNSITDLKEYKDKSDSTFLFYLVRDSHAIPCIETTLLTRARTRPLWQSGEKMNAIEGCNIPAIQSFLKENAPKNEV